ncbi:hypothetical protein QOT17_020250 [Balamuthia mandrillaris]
MLSASTEANGVTAKTKAKQRRSEEDSATTITPPDVPPPAVPPSFPSEDLAKLDQHSRAQIEHIKVLSSCLDEFYTKLDTEKARNETLTAENGRLHRQLKLQEEASKQVFNFLKKNDELQTHLDVLHKNAAELRVKHEFQLTSCEEKLQKTMGELSRQVSEGLERERELQLAQEEESTRVNSSLQHKDVEITQLKEELSTLQSFRKQEEQRTLDRLVSVEKQLEEKNLEIQRLRRELSDATMAHERQLQQARMKYEEHLLQISAEGRAGGATRNGDEYWRQKLMTQKREHEAELAALRQQLEEKTNNPRPTKRTKRPQSDDAT